MFYLISILIRWYTCPLCIYNYKIGMTGPQVLQGFQSPFTHLSWHEIVMCWEFEMFSVLPGCVLWLLVSCIILGIWAKIVAQTIWAGKGRSQKPITPSRSSMGVAKPKHLGFLLTSTLWMLNSWGIRTGTRHSNMRCGSNSCPFLVYIECWYFCFSC